VADRRELEAFFLKGLLILGLLYLVWLNLHLILLTLTAIMIAAALMPLADGFRRRRIPPIVTVGAIYIVGLGTLVLLIALLVPVLIEQGRMVVDNLLTYQDKIKTLFDRGLEYAGRYEMTKDLHVPSLGLEQITPFMQGLFAKSFTATRGVLSGALGLFLILFVAAYIVIDRRRLKTGLMAFVPPDRRERVDRLGRAVLQVMGGYIRGQTMVCLFVGLFIWLGLAITGFESALLVGMVAAAFNMVPYLGTVMALTLAVLLALNMSLWTVVWVLVLFGVEQFIEGNFVSPFFLGRQVEMHPLAVMAALVVGANLAGILGAIVAVPVVAGLNAIAQELYVKPARGRAEPA